MRTITKDELDIILEKHKSYIMGIDGGECANLHGANLSYANLSYANLSYADLHGANLHGANLSYANLSYANLSYADLSYADLHGADLCGTDLSDANLSCANLHGANLSCADLYGANLSCADLYGADLHGADLHGANLYGADLYGANLHGADLCGANLYGADISKALLDEKEQFRKGVILEKPMMGYKKLAGGSICVLSIPKGAIVFSINGSRCRTNKAKVLSGGGASIFDKGFIYKEGKSYEIEGFDLAYNEECSAGIHFFKTRKEAEEYAG